ncbi:hypothetical protein DIPPA_10078 [Diplonema papillatum]|nr:hypothetical protein DIPPA_10078 [Diplonema papillatum]
MESRDAEAKMEPVKATSLEEVLKAAMERKGNVPAQFWASGRLQHGLQLSDDALTLSHSSLPRHPSGLGLGKGAENMESRDPEGPVKATSLEEVLKAAMERKGNVPAQFWASGRLQHGLQLSDDALTLSHSSLPRHPSGLGLGKGAENMESRDPEGPVKATSLEEVLKAAMERKGNVPAQFWASGRLQHGLQLSDDRTARSLGIHRLLPTFRELQRKNYSGHKSHNIFCG